MRPSRSQIRPYTGIEVARDAAGSWDPSSIEPSPHPKKEYHIREVLDQLPPHHDSLRGELSGLIHSHWRQQCLAEVTVFPPITKRYLGSQCVLCLPRLQRCNASLPAWDELR